MFAKKFKNITHLMFTKKLVSMKNALIFCYDSNVTIV